MLSPERPSLLLASASTHRRLRGPAAAAHRSGRSGRIAARQAGAWWESGHDLTSSESSARSLGRIAWVRVFVTTMRAVRRDIGKCRSYRSCHKKSYGATHSRHLGSLGHCGSSSGRRFASTDILSGEACACNSRGCASAVRQTPPSHHRPNHAPCPPFKLRFRISVARTAQQPSRITGIPYWAPSMARSRCNAAMSCPRKPLSK